MTKVASLWYHHNQVQTIKFIIQPHGGNMKQLQFTPYAILVNLALLILLLTACQPLLIPPTEAEAETDAVGAYLTAYEAVEPAPLLTRAPAPLRQHTVPAFPRFWQRAQQR